MINSDILETAKLAAKMGGDIILKYFNKEMEFEQKEDKTFVSLADRESEDVIKKIILEKFPHHLIIGEESGKTGDKIENQIIWHIDPLDGTSNFKNKIPYCCVSIGIEYKGEFVVGVIYNPFSGEMFFAQKDQGAYLNNKRINVNSQNSEEGIIVLDASFSGKRGLIKTSLLKELNNLSSRFRMTGSNALQLAELSKGSYVASISDAVSSYDFAAGTVIAKEACAILTDQYGLSINSSSKVIIAANNLQLHERLVSLSKQYYDNYL